MRADARLLTGFLRGVERGGLRSMRGASRSARVISSADHALVRLPVAYTPSSG